MPRLEPAEINHRSFDFVVIGGGTAGCVLANRLSANGIHTVLVLEAGAFTQEDLINVQIPLFNSKLKNTDVDWKLKSIHHPEAEDRSIAIPLGKMLGGCSGINACLLHRCSPSDYDAWNSEQWSYKELQPYFCKAEHFHDDSVQVDQQVHGTSGPLKVTHFNNESIIGSSFKDACKKQGLPEHHDMTDLQCQIGVTGMDGSIFDGKRSSAGISYLPLDIQLNRPNLCIGLGCSVTRIIMDQENNVTHIEYSSSDQEDKETYTVMVNKEAILSAGAIMTPALLLQNGIGPKHELEKLGIPVKVDLPGVGKNLQNHWRVPLVHETTQQEMSLHHALFSNEEETLEEAVQSKSGALTRVWPDAVAYMKIPDAPDNSSSLENTPQIELFAGGLALCRELPNLKHVNCVTFLMVYVAPFSKGSVTLDTETKPIIDLGLLNDKRDMECLEKGLTQSIKIANDSEYTNKSIKKWIMHPDLEGDTQAYIRKNVDTLHHYAGTCKMGPKEDKSTVVDSYLKVHGVHGLRVVDASFFPIVPAGQICFPVIACAERASDLILKEHCQ